jgi:hypothetical protein
MFACKFVLKGGWGHNGVYGWKFKESQRVKIYIFVFIYLSIYLFYFIFSHKFGFLLWGFNGYKEGIIQLDWKKYKL